MIFRLTECEMITVVGRQKSSFGLDLSSKNVGDKNLKVCSCGARNTHKWNIALSFRLSDIYFHFDTHKQYLSHFCSVGVECAHLFFGKMCYRFSDYT